MVVIQANKLCQINLHVLTSIPKLWTLYQSSTFIVLLTIEGNSSLTIEGILGHGNSWRKTARRGDEEGCFGDKILCWSSERVEGLERAGGLRSTNVTVRNTAEWEEISKWNWNSPQTKTLSLSLSLWLCSSLAKETARVCSTSMAFPWLFRPHYTHRHHCN